MIGPERSHRRELETFMSRHTESVRWEGPGPFDRVFERCPFEVKLLRRASPTEATETPEQDRVTNPKVMIVEDEPAVAEQLSESLLELGYVVQTVENTVRAAIEAMSKHEIDLALMDIRLDGLMDGIEAAELILASYEIPIVYLTAYTDDETLARVRKSGPYAYVVKPFVPGTLHTTIQIALDKSESWRRLTTRGKNSETVLQVMNLTLDTRSRQARRSGKIIDLTIRECALLEYLMRNAGRVCAREQIIEEVWSDYSHTTSNVVDVYVRYLRRKINGRNLENLIVTVRGQGYKILDLVP